MGWPKTGYSLEVRKVGSGSDNSSEKRNTKSERRFNKTSGKKKRVKWVGVSTRPVMIRSIQNGRECKRNQW